MGRLTRFFTEIVEEIVKTTPKIVMEYSSGVSTIVIAEFFKMNGIGHVYSLEHNIDYGQRTRELLKKYNLIEWATVIDAPLTTCQTGQPWYDLKMLPQSAINVEVVIVDGPPEDTSRLARYPALPCLLDRLAASTLILVDDASRPDEISTIRKWIQEFPDFTHRALNCEKGAHLLSVQR
ncbi:MAG: class I SAM-dependent methyltransferase [Rhodoferax sp.]|nr:class I SAM-dependent methyltransferase [Rhodoferax sp.]